LQANRKRLPFGQWARLIARQEAGPGCPSGQFDQHFRTIATELLERKRREGRAEQTLIKLEWLLSLARSNLGARPIAEITAPEALNVLRAVKLCGRHEAARRLRATIGQLFRYSVATGRAEADPTVPCRATP
jgi:hypothetical protein